MKSSELQIKPASQWVWLLRDRFPLAEQNQTEHLAVLCSKMDPTYKLQPTYSLTALLLLLYRLCVALLWTRTHRCQRLHCNCHSSENISSEIFEIFFPVYWLCRSVHHFSTSFAVLYLVFKLKRPMSCVDLEVYGDWGLAGAGEDRAAKQSDDAGGPNTTTGPQDQELRRPEWVFHFPAKFIIHFKDQPCLHIVVMTRKYQV